MPNLINTSCLIHSQGIRMNSHNSFSYFNTMRQFFFIVSCVKYKRNLTVVEKPTQQINNFRHSFLSTRRKREEIIYFFRLCLFFNCIVWKDSFCRKSIKIHYHLFENWYGFGSLCIPYISFYFKRVFYFHYSTNHNRCGIDEKEFHLFRAVTKCIYYPGTQKVCFWYQAIKVSFFLPHSFLLLFVKFHVHAYKHWTIHFSLKLLWIANNVSYWDACKWLSLFIQFPVMMWTWTGL